MNQRQLGIMSELKVAEFFHKKGFWVYQVPSGLKGQPCDIIISKDNNICLIEVKHCKNDFLSLSRIEDNQISSYKTFSKNGNTNYFLIAEINKRLYKVHFSYIIDCIEKGLKRFSLLDFEEFGEILTW